jgi:hypothetical protein
MDDGLASASITQGQSVLQYIQDYLEVVPHRLQLLNVTSSPALQSVNEGLSADDSLHHRAHYNIKGHISQNERAFNRALLKYSNLQKSYTASVLQPNPDPGERAAQRRLQQQLVETNDDLVRYAQAIGDDINHIRVTDRGIRHEIQRQQKHLNSYIQSLVKERQRVQSSHGKMINAVAQDEHAALVFNSQRAQYIVWLLLTVAIMALTLHYIITGEPSSLLVVVFLLLIYLGAKTISLGK